MRSKLHHLLVLISFASIYGQKKECPFRTNGIVPDLIPTVPESILKVEYEGVPVNCGNLLSPSETHDAPTLLVYEADPNKLYTLLMIDPDIFTPQKPDAADFRHWLVENIPGNNVKNGDEVSPYFPTDPPDYSDAHRYIFLVYEQPNGQRIDDKFDNDLKKRMHFDHSKFIEDRNLQGPIAGNFFYCHH